MIINAENSHYFVRGSITVRLAFCLTGLNRSRKSVVNFKVSKVTEFKLKLML